MSARWESVLVSDSAYAKKAADAAASLSDLLELMDDVANGAATVAAAADIVDALLAQDPVSALLSALENVFDSILNDISAADIYMFPLLPIGWRSLLRPYTTENMLADLNTSLSDLRDPNRPSLSGPTGVYESVTLVAGANNWHDFEQTIRIFGQLFSGDEFNEWARFADLRLRYQDMRDNPIPRPQRYAHGSPRDWHRTNWQTLLPVVADVLQRAYDVFESLRGYQRGFGGLVREAIELLRKRIQYIRALAQEVSDLVDLLANFAQLLPRCRLLWAANDRGGTSDYLAQVNNAGNRPDFKLVGGVTLLLAPGPNPLAGFDVLKNCFGLQLARVEGAAAQAEAL